jgi:TldD protein
MTRSAWRRPPSLRLLATAAATAAAAIGLLSAQAPPNPPADPVLQAMHDEIQRARTLSIPNLNEPPYFIQYLLDQEENFNVSATLGGLVTRRKQNFRQADVRVRVGAYHFDNTNFAAGGFGGGSRYDLERFPTEDNYSLLRRYFWLETDSAYKSAVEAIARKRAALRNITQTDELDDLAAAPPMHYLREIPKLSIDEDAWASRVRSISAIFEKYPEIKSSGVDLSSSAGGAYVVNSEGTEVRYPEVVTTMQVMASSQAPDGMNIRDDIAVHALDIAHMPSDAEMERRVNALAQNVVALAHAPKGEDYSGPVLFEGEAGPQVFAEVLGRNLTVTRRPVTEGGRGGNVQPGDFEGRVGSRILPDYLTVVDDPTRKEWRGRPLFGAYAVDREGVAAQPLTLVEKGELKNYLLTRQPVKGYSASNGRARLPGSYGAATPTLSNLFVTSTETTPVADLKKKLIELVQQRNKPYGVIVRKMDFPSSATLDEYRRIVTASQSSSRPVSVPILAYRVFPDGREELIRGVRFRGFNGKSLRDIVAVGDDNVTLEYMENGAPMAILGGGGFTAEVSVVAPSVLIDDLELHPAEEEMPKLPIVSPPDMTKH